MNDLTTTSQTLPTELQDRIAAIMAEDKGVAYDPLPMRATLRIDRWWITQKGSEEPLEKREVLNALILVARKTRAAYGVSEQKAPSCVSLDGGRTGTLNDKLGNLLPFSIPSGQSCKTCPMNQFGTGRNKDGTSSASKFCGERRLLLALVEGYEDPMVISIPTMSCNSWDAYEDRLAKHLKTSYITQMTRITLGSKERSGSKDSYGVAKFETLGFNERTADLLTMRETFGEMLGTLMQQTEAEHTAPVYNAEQDSASSQGEFENVDAEPF